MFEPETEAPPRTRSSRSASTAAVSSYSGEPLDEEMAVKKRVAQAKPPKPSALDAPEARALYGTLMGFFAKEVDYQRENRAEQDLDHKFYDNEQWDERDRLILRRRGQKPLVINVTATAIDWIVGTERRARIDYKVLPRRQDGAAAAEDKTALLKYLGDVNRTPFHRSRAFKDAVKGGVGWLEDAVQPDEDGEPILSRYESWRNMLWDSACMDMDLANARFIMRHKWVDADMASLWFPDRADVVKLACQQNGLFGAADLTFGDDALDYAEDQMTMGGAAALAAELGYMRPRLRLIEAWFRKPGIVLKMRGGQFAGEVYDPWSEGHAMEINSGAAEVVESRGMRMHVAVMTTAGLLHVSESPYRHNGFPFTPVWAYRRDKDGLPYGCIRRLRGPQEEINWRAAKALHILATNKIIMDEGAVENVDELVEEAARPDAVIIKKPGAFLEMNAERGMDQAHMNVMERLIGLIESVGGVTRENMGQQSNARSGIAIQRRQDQGALATAEVFDNYRLALQISGEKQLSMAEQFMSAQKQFRITSARGTPKHVTINPADDPTRAIGASKADFIISEDAFAGSMRQAMAEQLLEFASQLATVAPEVAFNILDLLVELLELPNRDEIVQRIRKLNGQSDPDATEPTPEEIAKQEAMAEAQERAKRMEEATIAEKEGSAALKAAQAEKTTLDALVSKMGEVNAAVKAQTDALNAAVMAISARGAVPVADAILRESGFVSQSQKEEEAAIQSTASDLEQLALEGAAMQEAAAGAAPPVPQQPAPPMR